MVMKYNHPLNLYMRVILNSKQVILLMDVLENHIQFFITRSGRVYACGSNKSGQLGISQKLDDYIKPVMIRIKDDVHIVVSEKNINLNKYFISIKLL